MRCVGIEIFYWIENWSGDQKAYFERAKACGFDAVEISLVSGPDINIAEVRQELQRLNLAVFCSVGIPLDKDITSSDQQLQRSGIEYLKRCVETAHNVGSPILGGLPYVPWLYFPNTTDLRPYRDRAAKALYEVAVTAGDLGLTLCLEIINRFETFMFNTVEEGLEFLSQVDHPAVKLQLDTYHMNMEEDDIPSAIRQAADKIGHFHCAASNRKLPGKGHLDWAAIRSALDDVGYSSGLVIETFPNPFSETGRTVNTWRPLVKDFDAEAREAAQFIRTTLC